VSLEPVSSTITILTEEEVEMDDSDSDDSPDSDSESSDSSSSSNMDAVEPYTPGGGCVSLVSALWMPKAPNDPTNGGRVAGAVEEAERPLPRKSRTA
jgi:hypothetical protein